MVRGTWYYVTCSVVCCVKCVVRSVWCVMCSVLCVAALPGQGTVTTLRLASALGMGLYSKPTSTPAFY